MELEYGSGRKVREGWETKQRACKIIERDKAKRSKEEEQNCPWWRKVKCK